MQDQTSWLDHDLARACASTPQSCTPFIHAPILRFFLLLSHRTAPDFGHHSLYFVACAAGRDE